MAEASFRFYGELNDFLSVAQRQKNLIQRFDPGQSAKHLIEALGPPHPEVDLILVNGRPEPFGYLVQDGDRVSVYPRFRHLDLGDHPRLGPDRPPVPSFVLDGHLGRLAAYLRLMGFDTLYTNHVDDHQLAHISAEEARILLTRDQELLKRSIVRHGAWVRNTNPRLQLVEMLARFELVDNIAPFSRCLSCNGLLEPVDKEAIQDQLEPRTLKYYDSFHRCNSCHQVFWDGSHVQRMKRLISWAVDQVRGEGQ